MKRPRKAAATPLKGLDEAVAKLRNQISTPDKISTPSDSGSSLGKTEDRGAEKSSSQTSLNKTPTKSLRTSAQFLTTK